MEIKLRLANYYCKIKSRRKDENKFFPRLQFAFSLRILYEIFRT